MNAACFVPMILASAKRAEDEDRARKARAEAEEKAKREDAPEPRTDAPPKREGRVDRRG